MSPDQANALFELVGGLFVIDHCRIIIRDRGARGVSFVALTFFTMWGFWNVVYYPSLQQYWSTAAGMFLCLMNCTYMGLAIWFRRNP